jgi:protein-S-isoprenylcysteine O-methyltransferase Ste14
MSIGHLLLAVTLTAYMVVAVFWEERDLIAHFGDEYLDYRRRVPKFIPRFGRPKADRRTKADSGELQPATDLA